MKKNNLTDNRSEYMKNYRRKLKEVVYAFYGNKCVCCEETQPEFLTLDHINNDGYLDKTENGYKLTSATLWIKIIKNNFPSSYQILCFNCNIGKRINGGRCPHRNIIS